MNRVALLKELVSMIAAIQRHHPLRIAIDGVDGAGKTRLADELVEPLRNLNRRVIRASVDGFHNPASIRYRQGALSPRGYFLDSFNYEALRTNLLDPLGPGGSCQYRTRIFDHKTDSEKIAPLETAESGDVLLFDGIFLQRDELQGCWDVVIWVEAVFELTVERTLARDLGRESEHDLNSSQLAEKYIKRYVPGQKIYIEECRPRENAHVVVKNGDLLNPELDPGSAG